MKHHKLAEGKTSPAFCSNVEDYVHRIGRTGRQNKSGTSYTLFTEENHKCARELIQVIIPSLNWLINNLRI